MFLLKTLRSINVLSRNLSSTASLNEFKYKKMDLLALRRHALQDPDCGKEVDPHIHFPDSMGEAIGKRRYELLAKLYGEDPFDEQIVQGKKHATAEKPNLIPSIETRRNITCICSDDAIATREHIIFKNRPSRCSCGYWFETVSYEDYYKRINAHREQQYEFLKDTAEMRDLEKQLEKHQEEFDRLSIESREMTTRSKGAYQMMGKMKESWDGIITTRKAIEKMLDYSDLSSPQAAKASA